MPHDNASKRITADRSHFSFVFLNCVIPVMLGASLYYLLFPDVFFVEKFDSLTRCRFHIDFINSSDTIVRMIRNYLMDFLWGYSLMFGLTLVIGKHAAELLRVLFLAVIFSAGMELLQLTPFAKGTFDIFDILVEMLAEVLAALIIKHHFGRKAVNENQI